MANRVSSVSRRAASTHWLRLYSFFRIIPVDGRQQLGAEQQKEARITARPPQRYQGHHTQRTEGRIHSIAYRNGEGRDGMMTNPYGWNGAGWGSPASLRSAYVGPSSFHLRPHQSCGQCHGCATKEGAEVTNRKPRHRRSRRAQGVTTGVYWDG